MSEQGPRLLVNAEGCLVPRDQPWLRADDPGVLRGDGLFESLLVADGEPQLLEEHLARMERSATMMDLEESTSAVVIARGRQLLSPPVSLGILPSITVGRLFAAAADTGLATGYDRLTVDDLHQADGVWLLSSVRLAARVHTLDGVPLPDTGLHAQISELTGPARLTRAVPRRSCA